MENKPSDIIIEEKIRRVNGAMAQEGMPLDERLVKKLYKCFSGDTSIAEERRKTIEKYRHIKFEMLENRKHVR